MAEGQCTDIERLLKLGLDVNKTTGISGAPLLHRAAYCGHVSVNLLPLAVLALQNLLVFLICRSVL